MATAIDLGLFNAFVPLFVFLLVFGVLWAILEKIKLFGEKSLGYPLIAFVTAILFVLVPELVTVVQLATPWFIIFVVFLLFIVTAFMFMGITEKNIAEEINTPAFFWTFLIIFLAIFGYAFIQVYGDAVHDITAGDDISEEGGAAALTQNVGQILFQPKIMGMALLLAMAGLLVRFISPTSKG